MCSGEEGGERVGGVERRAEGRGECRTPPAGNSAFCFLQVSTGPMRVRAKPKAHRYPFHTGTSSPARKTYAEFPLASQPSSSPGLPGPSFSVFDSRTRLGLSDPIPPDSAERPVMSPVSLWQ